jgi:hypothetical protein
MSVLLRRSRAKEFLSRQAGGWQGTNRHVLAQALHPLDISRQSGEIEPLRLIKAEKECTEDYKMLGELLKDMAHSTTQGTVGVSLIFIYMAWIIIVALIRIKQGKAEGHH